MELEENSCKEQVYDSLYRKYAASLRNFIYFRSGNEQHAFDITQEAFIKLWENCKKVPPSKAKSYLYTVANNLFLNTVVHQQVVYKYAANVSDRINKQTPQYLLEEKEFEARLETAIANLTEVQRTAFLLSRVEGKKYREIAVILNISEKAAGKRIHDALEELRKQIKNI